PDYVPFQANGEIITGFFEYNYSPYPHTIHDSLVNLDTGYMFEIARASVAAGLYFAGAYDTVTTVVQKKEIPIANVYPNPFLQFLHIEPSDKISHSAFQLYNQRGNLICNIMIPVPGVTEIETLYLDPGLYFYRISDEDGNTLQEGKLMKVR
ncbi:MAG: T9SS type A sorting domain-containing protein, partial [Bacteroidetes bacterium]|nr:T9SS type A sorting domain-containing protein [Bacteroidota bacterium]